MSEKKIALEAEENVITKAKDVWSKFSKPIIGVCAAIILAGGGWLVYKNFFKAPNEKKAAEASYKAESYFRIDSIQQALNGDGQSLGFLKIASKYSGTSAGNLANYYAGACYVKLDQNDKAVKFLKEFSTDAKQIQARAYKLLGDAYGDLGKNTDALDYYKKAAHYFEKDKEASADALFAGAYFAAKVMKNKSEAIELFKELKEKYPQTQQGSQADNYLAQLGEYNVN